MKDSDLELYIEQLLNILEIKKEIVREIPNVKLLLFVYRLGLEKKELELADLLNIPDLKVIPEQFHILTAQLAIIKSGKGGRTAEYLYKSVPRLLKEFYSYF